MVPDWWQWWSCRGAVLGDDPKPCMVVAGAAGESKLSLPCLPKPLPFHLGQKKKEEMCQGLLQFGGSGVIWFIISEKFQSHRAALQTQRCYTPSKTHTGLSCPSSHLNTQKTHARRVTQTLISPTRAGNYKNYEVSFPLQIPHASLCVNALKPLYSPFSHGKKKKNRRPPHGLRVLRTGCVLAESRTPQWELGLQESTHTCWEQPCLAEGCMRIRVFLGMTYRVTNSPNCMSGLKTGWVFLRSYILNDITPSTAVNFSAVHVGYKSGQRCR